jgi:hypothetical protein
MTAMTDSNGARPPPLRDAIASYFELEFSAAASDEKTSPSTVESREPGTAATERHGSREPSHDITNW